MAHSAGYAKSIPAVSLFFVSFSSLALEVSLTRLFSVIFLHAYVYLLISLSMAGLGLGTVALSYMQGRIRERYFTWLNLLPILTFGLLITLNSVQINLFVSGFLSLLLFVYIGSSTTLVFQRTGLPIAFLYFLDLAGAATGALSSYYLLNACGAVKTIILLCSILAVALCGISWSFFSHVPQGLWLRASLILLFVLSVFFNLNALVTPQHNRLKEMSTQLSDSSDNPRIVESRWTAFGRSDLVETDNAYLKTLYIDGASGSKMLRWDAESGDPELSRALQYQYIGGIPLLAIPPERRRDALVIGSGGGIDVVTLLVSKFQAITAVEINPDFIDIVKEYGWFNGDIYNQHPQVTVIRQEGRSFVRASDTRYDVILMGLPIIKSARNVGSYALTENHLFTYNAFAEYTAALNEEGLLIIVAHYNPEVYRLVSNALKFFEVRGIPPAEAMRHIVVIGTNDAPAFIMKKTPFSEDDAKVFYDILRRLSQRGESTFIPYIPQHIIRYNNPTPDQAEPAHVINDALYAVSTGNMDLDTFISSHPENISWISDDSPFFYQMKRWLPNEILFGLAGVLLILTGFLALFVGTMQPVSRNSLTSYLCFGIVGFAFMVIEIGVIQKFILFWGQQTLALALMLSLLLGSTAIGSLVSNRLHNRRKILIISLSLIPIFALLFFLFHQRLLQSFEHSAFFIKIIISALCIFPLFSLMGVPFPTFLQRIKEVDRALLPWMIGINSITTLLGGIAAVGMAMLWGYRLVLLVGAAGYAALLPIVLMMNGSASESSTTQ